MYFSFDFDSGGLSERDGFLETSADIYFVLFALLSS